MALNKVNDPKLKTTCNYLKKCIYIAQTKKIDARKQTNKQVPCRKVDLENAFTFSLKYSTSDLTKLGHRSQYHNYLHQSKLHTESVK